MKITLAITAILGLLTFATPHWDAFWFMFKYQSVVSRDCGQNWTLIDFNEIVPEADGNPCYSKEVVPKEPLEGSEFTFIAQLGPQALLQIRFSYQYEIVDAPKYMKTLSNIARQVSARDNFEASASVWESARSLIIDRIVLAVARSPEVLQANGIGDVQQGEFDELVIAKANTQLSSWGIRLTRVMSS